MHVRWEMWGTRKGTKFIFSDRLYLQCVLDFTYQCQHTFTFQMSKMLYSKEFTTHSIRRSASRWAARCGANDSSI